MRTIKSSDGKSHDVTANQWIVLSWMATLKKNGADPLILRGLDIAAGALKVPSMITFEILFNRNFSPYRNMNRLTYHEMLTDDTPEDEKE